MTKERVTYNGRRYLFGAPLPKIERPLLLKEIMDSYVELGLSQLEKKLETSKLEEDRQDVTRFQDLFYDESLNIKLDCPKEAFYRGVLYGSLDNSLKILKDIYYMATGEEYEYQDK